MKKIIITLISAVSIIYLLSYCTKKNEISSLDNIQENVLTQIYLDEYSVQYEYSSENFLIEFSSINDCDENYSEVIITRGNQQLLKTTFDFIKSDPLYKYLTLDKVERNSKDKRELLSMDEWIDIKAIFDSFLKELVGSIDNEKVYNDMIKSGFYHMSIYNTIVRSYSKNGDCNCTPVPAYFINKSNFWCQEDFEFNIKQLAEYYEANKEYIETLKGGKIAYEYIRKNKNSKDIIMYSEISELQYSLSDMRSHIKNYKQKRGTTERKDCWLEMLGSDLGCCGNYSGCCWLATIDCLNHDIACLKCDKWHCGWACEPGIGISGDPEEQSNDN